MEEYVFNFEQSILFGHFQLYELAYDLTAKYKTEKSIAK